MKKLSGKGRIRGGQVVLAIPLPLADGTEVTVDIKPTRKRQKSKAMSSEEFRALPAFGMWAGRADMKDSVQWEREERAKWRQRSQRQD